MTKPSYPAVVNIYKWRYNQMSEPEKIQALTNYANFTLNDSIEGLDYLELLEWEHRHLVYNEIGWDRINHVWVYPDGSRYMDRPELSIPILLRGRGACGEFALLYTGLCLANNIPVRLVIDCSVKTDNRSAGDHVWNEVWIPRLARWVHIDPTEKLINQSDIYANPRPNGWNKNVNLVYAITNDDIVNVTESYN